MKDTGGTAFPGLHPSAECRYQDPGMTLRDYFAAKAMHAIITNDSLFREVCQRSGSTNELVAEMAYRQADAMIGAK